MSDGSKEAIIADVVGILIALLVIGAVGLGLSLAISAAAESVRENAAKERETHESACLSRNMQPVAGIYGVGKGQRYFRVCVAGDGTVHMFPVRD
jgi:streptogramin lyase